MMSKSRIFLILFGFILISSCSKDEGGKTPNPDANNKPQVKDVLKDKTKAEVLKIKYKELKAICHFKAVKAVRSQVVDEATAADIETMLATPVADPVTNPSKNTVSYDIKAQQLVDNDLSKTVTTKLAIAIENKNAVADITFMPLTFLEAIDLSLNGKRYIMKHTPKLMYNVHYSIEYDRDGSVTGQKDATIFENITEQRNLLTQIKVGLNTYDFSIECNLERQINDENRELQAEFDSQWAEIK